MLTCNTFPTACFSVPESPLQPATPKGEGPSAATASLPDGSLNAAESSTPLTASQPSKAQLRKEKERRSLGHELAGHRKKPRLEEVSRKILTS